MVDYILDAFNGAIARRLCIGDFGSGTLWVVDSAWETLNGRLYMCEFTWTTLLGRLYILAFQLQTVFPYEVVTQPQLLIFLTK